LGVGDLLDEANDAELTTLAHDGLLAKGRDLDVWTAVAHL
jgi:hypothetical protein